MQIHYFFRSFFAFPIFHFDPLFCIFFLHLSPEGLGLENILFFCAYFDFFFEPWVFFPALFPSSHFLGLGCFVVFVAISHCKLF